MPAAPMDHGKAIKLTETSSQPAHHEVNVWAAAAAALCTSRHGAPPGAWLLLLLLEGRTAAGQLQRGG